MGCSMFIAAYREDKDERMRDDAVLVQPTYANVCWLKCTADKRQTRAWHGHPSTELVALNNDLADCVT